MKTAGTDRAGRRALFTEAVFRLDHPAEVFRRCFAAVWRPGAEVSGRDAQPAGASVPGVPASVPRAQAPVWVPDAQVPVSVPDAQVPVSAPVWLSWPAVSAPV